MLHGSINQTIGGMKAFNRKTLVSLKIKPPLPMMLPVIKKSTTKLIKAVLMKSAIDYFLAKLILNLVLFEIFSQSTIK